jgi:hypothetical protein
MDCPHASSITSSSSSLTRQPPLRCAPAVAHEWTHREAAPIRRMGRCGPRLPVGHTSGLIHLGSVAAVTVLPYYSTTVLQYYR